MARVGSCISTFLLRLSEAMLRSNVPPGLFGGLNRLDTFRYTEYFSLRRKKLL